ncbi:glycosyl hydrolase 2 galactose-binding domain-containing protein [Phenylobacterium montanum]|uniref:Beta galactosidase jelly roll domain-containing protein n=1 Tax=Phenylobacterium montanum TaxID=2823693 RepID=A0A975G0L1_9CAUL|nr:LamG-like jellyroll fold domain-containing protein [Caulobacter sp. S6]QUD88918.1 beta galactosidase jelly roll domain-containing protein [Caulobacter sp. S6]
MIHPFRMCATAGIALAVGFGVTRAEVARPGALGPYDVTLLQGGVGMTRELPEAASLYAAGAAWSMSGWVRVDAPQAGEVVVAGLGDPATPACDCLLLRDGRLAFTLAGGARLESSEALQAGAWRFVAVTFDGTTARLFLDGAEVARAPARTEAVKALFSLGPVLGASPEVRHFGGSLAGFRLDPRALPAGAVKAAATAAPRFDLISFDTVGAHWPVQVTAWIGLQKPQDPWTLPEAKTAAEAPAAKPLGVRVALQPNGAGVWSLGDWRLSAAPRVTGSSAALSTVGFDDHAWLAATVPGTVLTTLIDRGVYPDPDHGLNNMAIPESLARQAYWYRTEFTPSPATADRRLTLTFQGINYAAEVWLNGQRLGDVKGAFIRGVFDVTGKLKPGQANALAVRVSPPPHPGIPSEESIAYGPGENGGSMAIDGPTFFATEGWDWIPGIRDRDTGLWQGVELSASGPVRVLDPDVITHLPLPRTDEADLVILAPIDNADPTPRAVTVEAAFDGVVVRKAVTAGPGRSEVRFDPAEFPALRVAHPRLWWPNGYGDPALHDLTVTVRDGQGASDARTIRFGMRELTYELSLFDHAGRLRRVEVDPTGGFLRGERLVDTRHEAISQTPNGWAQSLTAAGEASPAVKDLPPSPLAPYLVLKVNGTAIAARGGSWGMDDSRKRVSRERLEPYFRLHRDAHLNIIRNWMGQDTEESFYDLADQYGMLVLNDFWESTQNFQLEAQDPALFLANARDVILRDRHHPSIAVWFGRNEGVPQPIINEGLGDLVASLDGTRLYTGSSNRVNLQDSGPYAWRPPEQYFTSLSKGFAVEVGTPSLATLEAVKAMVPEADRWPISDTLAYHDWHFGGNGDVKSFMDAISREFGAPTSLEDFERKAQMLNYVDYRAIFEGFSAHLWSQNSGRLLWMTHPAWPSNHWQIYSADYDTQASYYGAMKAAEPLHAQMNLPDYALAVTNTTREPVNGLVLTSRVLGLDGKVLATRQDRLDAAANQVTTLAPLDLARLFAKARVLLVSLELRDAKGVIRSRNLYWQGRDEASLQALNGLAPQALSMTVSAGADGDEAVLHARLKNQGVIPALAAKLTLVDERGQRILPTYYSDNYVSLMPGEARDVEIRYPKSHSGAPRIELRGWNVRPAIASP